MTVLRAVDEPTHILSVDAANRRYRDFGLRSFAGDGNHSSPSRKTSCSGIQPT